MQGLDLPALTSLKRLLYDLKEVLHHPLPDVVAKPNEDDIYTWHGNVRSSEGCLGGKPVHFVLVFPKAYPAHPPECRLFTPVPHPNVSRAVSPVKGMREACWRLALFDCVPQHSTWSSAYTVQSVLVQLQALLLHEDLQYDTSKISILGAVNQAEGFKCPYCSHHGEAAPFPGFPHQDNGTAATTGRTALQLPLPTVRVRHQQALDALRSHQHQPLPAAVAPKAAKPAAPAAGSGPSTSTVTSADAATLAKTAAAAASTSGASSVGGPAADSKTDEWTEVKSKKPKPAPAMPKHKGKGKGKSGAPGKATVTHQASHHLPHAPGASNSKAVVSSSGAATHHPSAAAAPLQHKAKLAVVASTASTTQAAGPSMANTFSALDTKEAKVLTKAMEKGLATDSLAPPPAVPAQPTTPAAPAVLSKAARKNAARAKKRKEKQDQEEGDIAADADGATSSAPAPQLAAVAAACKGLQAKSGASQPSTSSGAAGSSVAGSGEVDAWMEVKTKGKALDTGAGKPAGGSKLVEELQQLKASSQRQLIKAVEDEVKATGASVAPESISAPVTDGHKGLFDPVNRDALLHILLMLQPADVAAVSQCCKGLRDSCRDGQLWLSLLQRHFPGSRLTGSSVKDWRRAFQLEAACVPEELQCFYSKASYDSDVLGLPLRYTINPSTSVIDYILADSDLLGLSMFAAGVTKTPTGEDIQAVLPVYVTAEHFERALPHLHKLLHKLGPLCASTQPGQSLGPEAWLEILPRAMTTLTVLLCDKGVSASHRALATFCQLHRLLLALCEHYNLWGAVSAKLNRFLADPANRIKAACPNLGLLYPLLSISPAHEWSKVASTLVSETFDRNILWMCKEDQNLVPLFQQQQEYEYGPNGKQPVADAALLGAALKSHPVSMRILMFNVAFLRLVACPPGASLERVMDSYDVLFGRPGAGLTARFQRHVRRILACNSWQEFFALAGLRYPGDGQLTAMLRRCWQESLRKKYHAKDTNFAAIHRRGVSKLLLKGESYSAPPGIKTIVMEERWRWRADGGTRYLDASCLLFDAQSQLLETIDYSHTWSHTSQGAVTHSGDVLDYGSSSGMHTINIQLNRLPSRVSHMYITMSSFAGAKLSDIEQPFVQVMDPDTQMDLCAYHLDTQLMAARRSHTSVVMCKVYRDAAVPSQWKIAAVGQLAQGSADNYMPLLEKIRSLQ